MRTLVISSRQLLVQLNNVSFPPFSISPINQLNIPPLLNMKIQVITETIGAGGYAVEDVTGEGGVCVGGGEGGEVFLEAGETVVVYY